MVVLGVGGWVEVGHGGVEWLTAGVVLGGLGGAESKSPQWQDPMFCRKAQLNW